MTLLSETFDSMCAIFLAELKSLKVAENKLIRLIKG